MTWMVGRSRLFRWCNGLGGEYPRLLLLLAQGWMIETTDDRYASVLLFRDETTTKLL